MEISVVMSVYNSENPEFLNRAIKSIWDDQIKKPDEIIIIQDGPINDGLSDVIVTWKKKLESKLVLIINESNIGLTKSLNKGIRVAKGKYIARMDSDDISLPERFKLQIEYMDSNPEISVLGGSIKEFNDLEGIIAERHFPTDNDSVLRYIHKASPVAHPAVLIRKSLFDENIEYNEQYRTSQDLALWFEILNKNYKIANLAEFVLLFRRNNNVYKRRKNRKDSKLELKIHLSGIYNLFGFSPIKSLYPLLRYIVRFFPNNLINKIYNGSIRKMVLRPNT